MRVFILAVATIMIFGALLINSSVDNNDAREQLPQVLAASTAVEPSDSMLEAVNAFRQQNGLNILQMSSELKQLTTFRVSDMVASQYYSHRSRDGTSYADIIRDFLPSSVSSCENLQLQNSDDINQAVLAWSKSLSHKECLLNSKLNVGAVSVAHFDDVSNSSDDSEASFVFTFIGSN
jgi:uncharacterized protein YkwD